MLSWLSQYSGVISAFANVAMLAVWFFYAQLLYSGFRRERRPRVLINKGVSNADLEAPCLICNMSKESIFIQGIFVDLETTNGTYSSPATDTETGEVEPDSSKPYSRTRQGPLASGSCLAINRFGDLIQTAADAGGIELVGGRPVDPDVVFRSLTITVVSIYGPEDDPFGAARKFELDCPEQDGRIHIRIRPMSLDTSRLNSKKEKARAKKMLRDAL